MYSRDRNTGNQRWGGSFPNHTYGNQKVKRQSSQRTAGQPAPHDQQQKTAQQGGPQNQSVTNGHGARIDPVQQKTAMNAVNPGYSATSGAAMAPGRNTGGYTPNPATAPAVKQNPSSVNVPHVSKQPDTYTQAAESANENNISDSFISMKICKVNTKDKVVDFSSCLIKAHDQDFANIHGVGGKDHAANSTICITICDYKRGTGDKSVSVKYNVDVEHMVILYQAAMASRLSMFGETVSWKSALEKWIDICNKVRQIMRKWLKKAPALPDGSRAIRLEEIVQVGKLIADLASMMIELFKKKSAPPFTFSKVKSNPYKKFFVGGTAYVPAGSLNIVCDKSRILPWSIQISNYDAPFVQGNNGSSSHNAKQAINKKECIIFLSEDDFCAAMVAVDRYVRLWEQRMFRTLDRKCTEYERIIDEKKNAYKN